jgi:uncharacterized membrane protein YhdT
MKSWQRCAGVFFLLVAAVVIYQSVWVLRLTDHGQPGSGFMPFGLGVLLAVLALWLILANLGAEDPGKPRVPFWERKAWLRPLLAIFITVIYGIVFDDVGAIVSVVVLVTGWLYFIEGKRIAVAVVTGVLTGLCVHLLFERFLQTPFPNGILF